MEPFIIDTILPAASGFFFLVQAAYYAGLYGKLYAHGIEPGDSCPEAAPLSVIIVAKDASAQLRQNLPCILEQDYPEFEVIVVCDRSATDCDDVLKLLEDKYSNLYHTFIPDSARYISHKKLGITMGIKASRYDWLVFTEPDCRPQSRLWLRRLARNFTPSTEIVLGYCNYENAAGFFPRKIAFDTLLNAMRYLGMAIAGHPYTGSGRNLAYRKSLYYKQKGFASHLDLQRGEDDLFVNEAANRHNTRVETAPESIVRISVPAHERIWREEKIGSLATARFFKGKARYLMGFETCSRLLFYAAVAATAVAGLAGRHWAAAGIAAGLWLLRFAMQLVVFSRTSAALGERRFRFTLPLFDILQPAWNFGCRWRRMWRREDEFRRK